METRINKIIFGLLLIIASSVSLAHTIYAPNDIPLLDNRFRIDPLTEQVTFVLNHSNGSKQVVLVRPDGSKIYYQQHPESVAWVTTRAVDIITIDNPMTGPWQAIADLNGENRIKLISKVDLKTNKLPLKLYAQEYITTHASLYDDNKLMTDKNYLDGAQLSISLIGEQKKQLTLYKDDGKSYDALPFDGSLTAHVYIDLTPGRYLLSIRTRNDIFMRSENKDAVVFPLPINYQVSQLEAGSKQALFSFKVDSEELDPESISINGIIKDMNNDVIGQVVTHSAGKVSTTGIFTQTEELENGSFTVSGKAFATTLSGREIELQLPTKDFRLLAKVIIPPAKISEPVATITTETKQPSIWENIWIISAIALTSLILISAIVFILLRRRRKNKQTEQNDELSLTELSLSELQPESIDLTAKKK